MDWKQILVNTITALIVAVVSGVLVWVFTREPSQREGVTYSVTQGGSFGTGANRLSVFIISLQNEGAVRSQGLNIYVENPAGDKLESFESRFRTPKPNGVQYKRLPGGMNVFVPNFLTSDYASLSFLYRGENGVKPKISMRSSGGIGREKALASKSDHQNDPIELFALFMTFAGFVLFTRFGAKNIINIGPSFNDLNNSAFILFHGGFVDKAQSMLDSSVSIGRTGPIILSNLAAIKAVLGDEETSRKLMRIANNWRKGKTDKSVVLFNEFIVLCVAGKALEGAEKLKAAIEMDKNVLSYCIKSEVVNNLRSNNADVDQAIRGVVGQ